MLLCGFSHWGGSSYVAYPIFGCCMGPMERSKLPLLWGVLFLGRFNVRKGAVFHLLLGIWVDISMETILGIWHDVASSSVFKPCCLPRWCPHPLGVIQDCEGETILSFSALVGFFSVNKAEVKAMRIGLYLACQLNLWNILLEGDALFSHQIGFGLMQGVLGYHRCGGRSDWFGQSFGSFLCACKEKCSFDGWPFGHRRNLLPKLDYWIRIMFICLWSSLACFSWF